GGSGRREGRRRHAGAGAPRAARRARRASVVLAIYAPTSATSSAGTFERTSLHPPEASTSSDARAVSLRKSKLWLARSPVMRGTSRRITLRCVASATVGRGPPAAPVAPAPVAEVVASTVSVSAAEARAQMSASLSPPWPFQFHGSAANAEACA